MRDAKFPSLNELIAIAREAGVKFIVCTTSMGIMGISEEAFIPEVDRFAGVATYLAEAKDGKVNLFI